MPKLPTPLNDYIKLADWLELAALTAGDESASSGDLERALHRSGSLETAGTRESVDDVCLNVFSELESRLIGAGESYPFVVDGPVLRLKSVAHDFPTYIFCLCLSALVLEDRRRAAFFPRRMFERLSCIAAQNYLGGQSLRFAAPRDHLPGSFKQAVSEVCKRIGEGVGFREQPTFNAQDDTLDVVAWKPFPDALPGKLVLFGQCASGIRRGRKRTELDPSYFCEQWMSETPVNTVIKAFFMPHRLPRPRWRQENRKAGVVFDRCRISYWARSVHTVVEIGKITQWNTRTLAAFCSGKASML